MARRKPKIKLKRKSANCKLVTIAGRYNDNPIGHICEKPDGTYTFNSFMMGPNTKAPAKTKKSAVLKVVKDYQRWIGLGPGKLTI